MERKVKKLEKSIFGRKGRLYTRNVGFEVIITKEDCHNWLYKFPVHYGTIN